jgi:polysaccharide biosynthesis protein PslH
MSQVPNALPGDGPVGERRRPRFALVSPYLPAPEDSGGRIRIAALARGLARQGEVTLFARAFPVELQGPASRRLASLEMYRAVHLFTRDLPSGLPGWTPWRARDATPRGLLRALRDAHRREPFDAVIACHAYAAAALQRVPGARTVLDEHNLESRYARDVLRAGRLEVAALARFERRAWSCADLVTCVRDDDAGVIRAGARGDVRVVPNGVHLPRARWRRPSARTGRGVIFLGAMSHPPNVAAAEVLAREVLPRLRVTEPDATLVLCGRAPSPRVRALQGPGVTVTGTVDDPAPFLYDASVFANALPGGEGTSLKVLEAAAAGLPLVSTPEGIRGFALRDGEHAWVAQNGASLADAILRVWRDPDEADRRAHAALDAVRDHDWTRLGDDFADAVRALPRSASR